MTGRTLILGFGLAAAAATAAWAAEHYAISPGQVVAAMDRAGMQVSPDQVTLLANVVATTPAPVLKLSSLERLDSERMLARLECARSEECLPFFVSLRATQRRGAEGTAEAPDLLPAGIPSAPRANSPVLRTGMQARLLLEGNHVHIDIPVICLESGAIGQTIRVTDRERRVVFMAQVMDGGQLKGRLQ